MLSSAGPLASRFSLYLIANAPSFEDKELFFQKIFDSVRGGVSCVQLRDHDSCTLAATQRATRLRRLLGGRVPLLVNSLDSHAVAVASSADGIHFERGVPSLEAILEVRKSLGKRAIIGASVKEEKEIEAVAQLQGVLDYVSLKVGRSRSTCPLAGDRIWGASGLERLRERLPGEIPIVAVGGLTVANVAPILRLLGPRDGVAMAGGLMNSECLATTAQEILGLRRSAMGQK